MRAISIGIAAVGVVAVVAGVLIEGTTENPWNLAWAYRYGRNYP